MSQEYGSARKNQARESVRRVAAPEDFTEEEKLQAVSDFKSLVDDMLNKFPNERYTFGYDKESFDNLKGEVPMDDGSLVTVHVGIEHHKDGTETLKIAVQEESRGEDGGLMAGDLYVYYLDDGDKLTRGFIDARRKVLYGEDPGGVVYLPVGSDEVAKLAELLEGMVPKKREY